MDKAALKSEVYASLADGGESPEWLRKRLKDEIKSKIKDNLRKEKEFVEFKAHNYDDQCYQDIMTGNGFMITEPATFTVDDTKFKSVHGPRSPLYGTTYDDETSVIRRFRCSCGKLVGLVHLGEKCPRCGQVVEERTVNMKYTGWITLGEYSIINPFYYNKLLGAIGKGPMEDMVIKAKRKVDIDGNIRPVLPDDLEEKPDHPFFGIGLVQFKDRFEEIIDFFKKKKKKKADVLDRILEDKRKVFTSHIPVYSTTLRPQSNSDDTYYYNTIDKQINPIVSLSFKLKDSEEIDIIHILSRIQTRANKLWDVNFELINGKEGHIRGLILGGSLNSTARNVIIPDPTLRDNEIDMSYHTFHEIFKFLILHYLTKVDGLTYPQALEEWERGRSYSDKIYYIMQYILKTIKLNSLINRNPTLNYYSMLRMKIRKVKRDASDYTMSVPLSCLPGLNADFDGDILNIIGISTKEIKYIFRKFDPVKRMMISRDTGLFNNLFGLQKGQLIDLMYFATM